MKKGTKLYSIFKYKCPHCHEGKFFKGSPFKGTVKESCDSCGRKFSVEPGFYQGSYYVTYALGVAVFVAAWVATAILTQASFNDVLGMLLYIAPIALLIFAPFMYPLSKIIWANFFFNYKHKSNDK